MNSQGYYSCQRDDSTDFADEMSVDMIALYKGKD